MKEQPLYDVLKRIRKPVALRDIMALCLRHVLMGDPFSDSDKNAVPKPDPKYLNEVVLEERDICGLRCAIYRPKQPPKLTTPVMFYMHGGGFVVGCSEDTDYITRRLSYDNQFMVVSINYPLAPDLLPPAVIFVGSEDPLLDQARAFYSGLKDSSAICDLIVYEGLPHCFYSFPGLYAEEDECYRRIQKFLSSALMD